MLIQKNVFYILQEYESVPLRLRELFNIDNITDSFTNIVIITQSVVRAVFSRAGSPSTPPITSSFSVVSSLQQFPVFFQRRIST